MSYYAIMGDRRQLDNRIKALHGQLEVAAQLHPGNRHLP
jgi:hypothetical protein